MDKTTRRETSGSDRWWVIRQHTEVTVVRSATRPELKIEAGDRLGRVFGPYATQAEADTKRDERAARTIVGRLKL